MIGPTRSRSLHFFQINPVKKRKADTEVLVVSVSMHIFELFGNQGGHLVPVKIVWSVLVELQEKGVRDTSTNVVLMLNLLIA